MFVLVFGMDGNILDNYPIKARCAGKALQKNVFEVLRVRKSIEFFSKIYIETSGMNSLKQFEIAFKRLDNKVIPKKVLLKTEKDFRKLLVNEERNIKIFEKARLFFQKYKEKYYFAITTTVPVRKIAKIVKLTKMDRYFGVVCARDGVWDNGKIRIIKGFDKGKQHYDFLIKRFNSSKKKLIAVSSTKSDILNAKSNKVTSIATKQILDKRTLIGLSPDYIISDFGELDKVLNRIK